MSDSSRPVALGLGLAILAGLLGAGNADAATAKPLWSVGDYWEYEIAGGISPTGSPGTLRAEVVAQESLTVGGVTHSAYKTNLTFNVSLFGSPVTVPGNAWFRTSDLALIKLNFTLTIVIFFPITTDIAITYSPPVSMRWPLTDGATWDATSTVTVVTEIRGQAPRTETETLSATLTVAADETVTVPAGTFVTTPVHEEEPTGNFSQSFWSAEAGNVVEERSYDSTGNEVSSMELSSYSYTPPSGAPSDTIFGLPWFLWVVIFLIVGAAVVVLILVRRRPPMPAGMPPSRPQAPGPPPPP